MEPKNEFYEEEKGIFHNQNIKDIKSLQNEEEMFQTAILIMRTADKNMKNKNILEAKQNYGVSADIFLNIAKISIDQEKVEFCKTKIQYIIKQVYF